MRMAMKNKAWKANATMLAVCAGLAGVMCGCGDDTVGGTSGETMTGDGGGSDAATQPDSTVADSGSTPDTGTSTPDATTDSGTMTGDTGTGADVAVADSSTQDTGVVDSSATDTGAKDVAVADVSVEDANDASPSNDAGQTLCQIFNSEYVLPPLSDGGPNDNIDDVRSWADEIITGPASNVLADGGSNTGYNQNTIGLTARGCAMDSLMYYLNNVGAYGTNVNHFEQRVFGCTNAPAYQSSDGYAFALVPAEYTGPLTQTDLDSLVAFYIQQAQLVFENHGVTITQSQIDEMTQLLKATESLYPQITDAGGSSIPICVDADGGIN